MAPGELKERTMKFALRVLDVVDALPKGTKGWAIGRQLCRSGTSVAANYRAAARAKSPADFIHKLSLWKKRLMRPFSGSSLIVADRLLPQQRLQALIDEANELLAITVSSIKTAKAKR